MSWRAEASSIVWVTLLPWQRDDMATEHADGAQEAVDKARARGADDAVGGSLGPATLWQIQINALRAQILADSVTLEALQAVDDAWDAAEAFNPEPGFFDKAKAAVVGAADAVKDAAKNANNKAEETTSTLKWVAYGALAVGALIGVGYVLSGVAKVKGA